MNTLALIAITWIGKEYRFLGLDWSYLMVLGFIGNALFSMRFLVQWLASERQGESVILPARSDWDSRLSAKLPYLHSQSDADPETQVCLYGRRAFAKTARRGLTRLKLNHG